MRKIIFTICFLLCSMMVMAQGVSYKIKGQLPKSINSEIYLVATDDKGPVAIGNSIVKDGAFAFEGNIPSPTVLFLVPKEQNAIWATLFLYENGEYTISTDATGGIIVNGGGENQKIFGEFEAINKYVMKVRQQYELKAKSISDPEQLKGLQAILSDAAGQAQNKFMELLKKYNNSHATAFVIASNMMGSEEKSIKECYNLLGSDAKSSLYGKTILTHLSKLEKIAIDATTPDFSAALADGGTMKLYETDAKVKVVYFWATGAAPCRDENVNMLKLYKQYRPKGLEIIGVSLDKNRQTWLTILGEDGATWKNIIDATGEIASKYCVTSIPAIFVLDGNNKIVAKNVIDKDLKSKVEEMLNKK